MKRVIEKPPYRVPLMSEIAEIPWNGLNAISTFSGCGGSSLGYKMAGFRVLWASEFIPAAQDVYRANHPTTFLDTRDIRIVNGGEILEQIGMKPYELDLFDGSPPCASFSTSGSRDSGWGKVKKYSDTKQRTDDLFFEYVRLVKEIQPKVFVAENVSGLVKGIAKGYFLEILTAMKASGYRVVCRVLDAQWLGVPQQRTRAIFIGVRDDLNIEPVHPLPLPYRYSVRDALPWIRTAIQDPCGQVEAETDISKYCIGKEWDSLKQGEQSKKYVNLIKAHTEKPSPAILACSSSGSASVVHPTQKRKFSIAELRRICAFPDDFILLGKYSQQWERLGRAVPPVMMQHIASMIRDKILMKKKQA